MSCLPLHAQLMSPHAGFCEVRDNQQSAALRSTVHESMRCFVEAWNLYYAIIELFFFFLIYFILFFQHLKSVTQCHHKNSSQNTQLHIIIFIYENPHVKNNFSQLSSCMKLQDNWESRTKQLTGFHTQLAGHCILTCVILGIARKIRAEDPCSAVFFLSWCIMRMSLAPSCALSMGGKKRFYWGLSTSGGSRSHYTQGKSDTWVTIAPELQSIQWYQFFWVHRLFPTYWLWWSFILN